MHLMIAEMQPCEKTYCHASHPTHHSSSQSLVLMHEERSLKLADRSIE